MLSSTWARLFGASFTNRIDWLLRQNRNNRYYWNYETILEVHTAFNLMAIKEPLERVGEPGRLADRCAGLRVHLLGSIHVHGACLPTLHRSRGTSPQGLLPSPKNVGPNGHRLRNWHVSE